MLVRGNKMMRWVIKPEGDATWSDKDWGRAATLEARWKSAGMCEDNRRRLIPCAIWIAKFPGMRLDESVMSELDVWTKTI
jgi:hypothetical protein